MADLGRLKVTIGTMALIYGDFSAVLMYQADEDGTITPLWIFYAGSEE